MFDVAVAGSRASSPSRVDAVHPATNWQPLTGTLVVGCRRLPRRLHVWHARLQRRCRVGLALAFHHAVLPRAVQGKSRAQQSMDSVSLTSSRALSTRPTCRSNMRTTTNLGSVWRCDHHTMGSTAHRSCTFTVSNSDTVRVTKDACGAACLRASAGRPRSVSTFCPLRLLG